MNRRPDLADCPTLLHDFFLEAAERHPEACAVDIPPAAGRPPRRRVTYSELRGQATSISVMVSPLLGAGSIVAILLPRTTELLYASQIGVLLSGAAYAAIDPVFPDGHIRRILDDALPAAVLTDSVGAARMAELAPALPVFDVGAVPPTADGTPDPAWLDGDSLAYLIYTSGTTGDPKGVMVAHRSIANLIGSDCAEFGLGPGDRVAQGSSPAYDSSVEEAWLALATGATVVAMDDETVRMGPDLVSWLQRERITVLCPPPTLLRSTGCSDPWRALPELRLLYVGGEALTPDVADLWAVGRRLVNGYGPTECTVTAMRAEIRPGDPITIGTPVPGLSAWVVDDRLRAVPDGQLGELCLGGVGLARGYWRAEDLTRERFPVHAELGRVYRTGDLARREADGRFTYHGRIDRQVKLRGYRVELEAVESSLVGLAGVREAACRLQGPPGSEELVAHLVPEDAESSPEIEVIQAALATLLPTYMVPTRFGWLQELPKTTGGKLRRDALPDLQVRLSPTAADPSPAASLQEALVSEAMEQVLGLAGRPSVEDDFFAALGGNSLLAARLVSALRADPRTAAITVRDIYEARTARGIAVRCRADEPATVERAQPPVADTRPAAVTAIQAAWLLGELVLATVLGVGFIGGLVPWLLQAVGPIPIVLAWPLLGALGTGLYLPLALAVAWAAKRCLIGRYREGSAPVYGWFGLRHWMVLRAVRMLPWAWMEGTELACIALRCLGARIGRRVYFHRGAIPLQGGWDLLEIGDDVTLSQEASVRAADLQAGRLVLGRVSLAEGVTLGVRAGVGMGCRMGAGSSLGPLASLGPGTSVPAGEHWDGIPATRAEAAPDRPQLPPQEGSMSPTAYALAATLARAAVAWFVTLPLNLLLLAWVLRPGSDPNEVGRLALGTELSAALQVGLSLAAAGFVLAPAAAAVAARWLGRIRPGVISLRSPGYLRVWLKSSLVDGAGRVLSGTLFWPLWLRAAGMKVGADCEISTVIDVVPELIEIGPASFLADGIYLGPPEIHRGAVRLAPTSLGRGTFIGNHAVIPAGRTLPEEILVGVCTVAPVELTPGSSWFGHPPFPLPRREVVECDRSLTHAPGPVRYWTRVFWETLRVAVPMVTVSAAVVWLHLLTLAAGSTSPVAHIAAGTLASLVVGLALVLLVLALKWLLLGRVRPGTHALWSCWCSRWDFLYVAWGEWARPLLEPLEGTLLLHPFLRAMGMRIGRSVVLSAGFAHVVDPDMLRIGDGATVSAMFQAHTFEDRVLKIGYVTVGEDATLGPGTVPLYGAEVGTGTVLAPHSVVMKEERLLAGLRYEGAPSRTSTPRFSEG